MNDSGEGAGQAARSKRADARRNKETLLDAAAAVFVASGVEAPVRDIAAEAGVGLGTIYRHFPTRADLIIAVYRHQVEACAEAGPALLASSPTPTPLWGNGSTSSWTSWSPSTDSPPCCGPTTPASTRCTPTSSTASCPCAPNSSTRQPSREIRSDLEAYELMRGVGNLCVGADSDPHYDARRLVELLIAGLRRPD